MKLRQVFNEVQMYFARLKELRGKYEATKAHLQEIGMWDEAGGRARFDNGIEVMDTTDKFMKRIPPLSRFMVRQGKMVLKGVSSLLLQERNQEGYESIVNHTDTFEAWRTQFYRVHGEAFTKHMLEYFDKNELELPPLPEIPKKSEE